MTKIEKVMIFDDKECYEDKVRFLQGVNDIMKRSFKDCKTLENFEISQSLKVQFFFIKDNEYYEISEGDAVSHSQEVEKFTFIWYNFSQVQNS